MYFLFSLQTKDPGILSFNKSHILRIKQLLPEYRISMTISINEIPKEEFQGTNLFQNFPISLFVLR
jgi:hypothetical protein